MKVGSMFAGIGGFDLGFERAGFEIAWCIEWDKAAQSILRRHFPKAKIYGDISQLDGSELERVDVVCGGFPCQDLSRGGHRAGIDGSRSRYFYDAVRIVRRLSPSVCVLENVPGLLTSNEGRDFATVIREMAHGWSCSSFGWRVLDSRYFGTPQRRRRMFMVSSRFPGGPEQILSIEASRGGHLGEIVPHGQITSQAAPRCAEGNLSVYRKSRRAQNSSDYETWVIDGLANTLNGFDVGDKRTTHVVIDRGSARRLTPVECERLQGFPDDWTANQADTRRYAQIGNAVTVNVAEWIANNAKSFLRRTMA